MAVQSNYEGFEEWYRANREADWSTTYGYGFSEKCQAGWKYEEGALRPLSIPRERELPWDVMNPTLPLRGLENLRDSLLRQERMPKEDKEDKDSANVETVDVLEELMMKAKADRASFERSRNNTWNDSFPNENEHFPNKARSTFQDTTSNFTDSNFGAKFSYGIKSGDYNVWNGDVAINIQDRDWKTRFEWQEKIEKANKEVFGNPSFRPKQMEVINAVLSQRDVFVMMPTGGGKSLCFQLPAAVSMGLTVVVLPLLSLMQDQVDQMTVLNVKSRALFSTQSLETQHRIYSELENNEGVKLLYVTPEKISGSSKLISLLHKLNKNAQLDRFAIDEVHCVSQWGNDFRSQYCDLKKLRIEFANVPIVALTASATVDVLDDVIAQLRMREPVIFQLSFNRPNLSYEIYPKAKLKVAEDIADLIKMQFSNVSGIVYCLSKKECEKMTDILKRKGIEANFYHGDVEAEKREEAQRDWMNDDLQVIVATVAFGMGINKKDVRFVIHSAMPKSLENYYQESGRAGRDGNSAICILYYDYYDKQRQQHLIESTDHERKNENQLKQKKKNMINLLAMLNYCEEKVECRRKLLLKHFGETFAGDCQSKCDNCRNRLKYEVIEKPCESAVSQVIATIRECKGKRLDSGLTMLFLKDILLGKKSKRLQRHEKLSHFGCLKRSNWTNDMVLHLLHEMVIHQVLYEKCFTSQSMFGAFTTYVDIGRNDTSDSLKYLRYLSKSMTKPGEESSSRDRVPYSSLNTATPVSANTSYTYRIYDYTIDDGNVNRGHDKYDETPASSDGTFAEQHSFPRKREGDASMTHVEDKINRKKTKAARVSNASTNSALDRPAEYSRGDQISQPIRAYLKSELLKLRILLSTENSLKNSSSIISMEGIDELIRGLPTTLHSLKKHNIKSMNTSTKIERYGIRFVERIRQFLLENGLAHLVEAHHIAGGAHSRNECFEELANSLDEYVCIGGSGSTGYGKAAHLQDMAPIIDASYSAAFCHSALNRDGTNRAGTINGSLLGTASLSMDKSFDISMLRKSNEPKTPTQPPRENYNEFLDIIKQLDEF